MSRILIVDDNVELAENLAEILECEGIEAVVMTDSREVKRRAAELGYDAAMIDVRMPEVDGIELCKALHDAHPEAKHLLMTAFTTEERLGQAQGYALRILWKPFGPDELLATLRELGAAA